MTAIAERKDQELVTQPATMLEIIARAARDPDVDVGKLERLMAMHERVVAGEASKAYAAAMTAAQKAMTPVSTDARNDQTKSNYATYAKLDKALRPIYLENGFSLSFGTADAAHDGYVRVTCDVAHKGGHTERKFIDMPADGMGAKGGAVMSKTHAVGAGTSYGMRYLLKMIFNVAIGEEDTDGNDPPKYIGEGPSPLTELLDRLDVAKTKSEFAALKQRIVDDKRLSEGARQSAKKAFNLRYRAVFGSES
jgi:hypothetical protein